MVELVDTLDLKSNDHYDRGGSSPPPGTIARIAQLVVRRLTDAKVGFSINVFLFENGVTR